MATTATVRAGKPTLYTLSLYMFTRICLWVRTCVNFFKRYFKRSRETRRPNTLYSSDEDDDDYNNRSTTEAETHDREREQEDQCYICLEKICFPSATKMLPCSHNNSFHVACLWKWVLENSSVDFPRYGVFNVSCPVCRTSKVSQICDLRSLNRIY